MAFCSAYPLRGRRVVHLVALLLAWRLLLLGVAADRPRGDHTCRAVRSIVEISLAAWACGGMAARGWRRARSSRSRCGGSSPTSPSHLIFNRQQTTAIKANQAVDTVGLTSARAPCLREAGNQHAAITHPDHRVCDQCVLRTSQRSLLVRISRRTQALLMRHERFVHIENAWCGFGAYFPGSVTFRSARFCHQPFDRNC